MAKMPDEMRIIAAPNTDIVDVLCQSLDCRFNLANASNTEDGKETRCNLKQIIIFQDGKYKNFEKMMATIQ